MITVIMRRRANKLFLKNRGRNGIEVTVNVGGLKYNYLETSSTETGVKDSSLGGT